ncbi:MAG: metallophosphoesterase [Prevotella sp.]|nr:metallophosphoesterase [Prevotella sp.]
MIARILIPVLLMIVLADGYVHLRYLRGRVSTKAVLLWWLPGALMVFYTVFLALQKDFAPSDNGLLDAYLFLLGMIVVPKLVFVICSAAGWGISCMVHRLLHRSGPRLNYGNAVGVVMVLLIWYVLFYGSFVGFGKLTVRHVEYASEDLPEAFDGYRIVHFSDAHVGTYGRDRQHMLRRNVDSIMAQRPDMIVFTGDLQNMQPGELTPHETLLASLNAPDGVFSVLGNHDYADYIKADEATKAANCRAMVDSQRRMGWTLLNNENRTVRRGADSIVVAGMENDGDGKKFPQKGDIAKTLRGVGDSAFVIMLEHDPSSWRRKILPQSATQLTLSGHTHAMQFALWGWSPASLVYSEWGGMFTEGSRAINVSTGLGGFIPFRFGVPGEIVVITLKKK